MNATEHNSRAWHQRRELGPMLHELGHEYFDSFEARILAGDYPKLPVYNGEIVPGTSSDWCFVGEIALNMVGLVISEIDENSVTEEQRNELHRRYVNTMCRDSSGKRLTFFPSYEGVMREGLATGIVMPLQLYRAIQWVETPEQAQLSYSRNVGKDNEKQADISQMVSRLRQQEFVDLLHELAFAVNNTLGPASSQGDAIMNNRLPDCFTHITTLLDIFECDEEGHVIRLNQARSATYRGDVKGANRSSKVKDSFGHVDWEKSTGGCPLRHESFEKIGPVATQFFHERGTPNDLPTYSGQSLISRGAELVANVLEKTYADGSQIGVRRQSILERAGFWPALHQE